MQLLRDKTELWGFLHDHILSLPYRSLPVSEPISSWADLRNESWRYNRLTGLKRIFDLLAALAGLALSAWYVRPLDTMKRIGFYFLLAIVIQSFALRISRSCQQRSARFWRVPRASTRFLRPPICRLPSSLFARTIAADSPSRVRSGKRRTLSRMSLFHGSVSSGQQFSARITLCIREGRTQAEVCLAWRWRPTQGLRGISRCVA